MARSLYLYRCINNNKIDEIRKSKANGLIASEQWPIVGLDRKRFKGRRLKDTELNLELKQFEIEQRNFEMFIKYIDVNSIFLNNIEFTEELSEDENIELHQYIKLKEIKSILKFLQYQRDYMLKDIAEIQFTDEKINRIKVNFSGVISMDFNSDEEAIKLLSSDQF